MRENQEGYYHCHGCGKYFKATGGGGQKCSHCGVSQLVTSVWDDVIRKRDKNISFEVSKIVENEGLKKRTLAPDETSRKKARQRLMVTLLGLAWVVGVSAYIYKKQEKVDLNKEVEFVVDGSISSRDYRRLKKEVEKCTKTLNNFITSSGNLGVLKYIVNSDFDMVETFYEIGGKPNKKISSKVTRFRIVDDKANLIFTQPGGLITEAAFLKKGGRWLLDWQAYVNYSEITLRDFLEEKPEEEYDFRLLFTHKKYGLSTALNLFEYNRNSAIINGFTGRKVTITLDNNHSCIGKLNKAIKANENYLTYNNILSDSQAGCFGFSDPSEHYRIRVTLAFENKNGIKVLALKDIKAAHWLGDYYENFLRGEQELLLDQ